MTMKKSEVFALIAGVLGFVVDVIALVSFIGHAAHGAADTGSLPRSLAIVLLVYGWFIVSWVLAQWRITAKAKGKQEPVLPNYSTEEIRPFHMAMLAVIVVGLLLLPIAIMIAYDILRAVKGASAFDIESLTIIIPLCLLSMGGIGGAVFVAIMCALAIFNDEEVLN